MKTAQRLLLAMLIATVPGIYVHAQDGDATEPQPAAEDAPAAAAESPSADEVMQDLLDERQEPPTIAPTQQPGGMTVPPPPSAPPVGRAGMELDPAVLGPLPGEPAPTLRREGEFLVNRRGRLIRSDAGEQMFVFEADSQDAPEPPMILQPCRRLQDMEDIVQQRGESVVFIVSGQVHVYRGQNFLLPTMMTIAVDRGNLEN